MPFHQRRSERAPTAAATTSRGQLWSHARFWFLWGCLATYPHCVLTLFVLEPWPTWETPCVSVQATDCADVRLQMQCRDKVFDYTITLDHDAWGQQCTERCGELESFSWTVYCAGVTNSGLRLSPFALAPRNDTGVNCAPPSLHYHYHDCAFTQVSLLRHPNSTTSAWVLLAETAELQQLSVWAPELVWLRANHSRFTYTLIPTDVHCPPFTATAEVPAFSTCTAPAVTGGAPRNDAQLVVGVFYFATCVMYFLMNERLGPAFVFAGFATFANLFLPNTISREIFFLAFLFAVPLQLLLGLYHWLRGGVAKLRIPDLHTVPRSSIVLFAFGIVQIIVSYYGH